MSAWNSAIVVGASSGIGRELVKQLAAQGCRVTALARREELLAELASDLVRVYQHDVHAVGEVEALFEQIEADQGPVDLVVYSTGILVRPGLDVYDTAADAESVAVNLTGAMAWMNAAAPKFQARGTGTLVAIGSVAGDRGRRAVPAYHASKAGLATFMESMRNRLVRHGVTVVTVKPGPVDTDMTRGLGLKRMIPVEKAAAIILKKARRSGEFYLSPAHAVMFAVIRAIPSPIFRRLNV